MSDRDAFLAAIRAAPDDDAPRLVYADWLEENGDPEWAEFMRLQCQLDPLWRSADPPEVQLAWDTVIADSAAAGADLPPHMRRLVPAFRREQDLLHSHRGRWLGPMSRLDDDPAAHLWAVFRRGFVDEVALATSAFRATADAIRSACPFLRRLTLYGPRDQVPEFAGAAGLAGIPELELAGWLTPFDARFLANSYALQGVRSLTLWVGSEQDFEVVRTLATRPWADDEPPPTGVRAVLASGPYLGNLREVVLVQLYGGLLAGDEATEADRRADALANEFNRLLGRSVARVERPFGRLFPLAEVVGAGLFAGRLPNGPALVYVGHRPCVVHFRPDGQVDWEAPFDPTAVSGRWSVPGSTNPAPESWPEFLREEYGFEPGPIFVREFATDDGGLRVHLWGAYEDVVMDPDARSDGDGHEETCAVLDQTWLRGTNFAIDADNSYWAGPDGKVHSS